MADRSGYALLAAVVESHYSTVAERELYLALTLLTGHLAGHRTVNLVCEPVLGCHSLQAEHIAHIILDLIGRIFKVGIRIHHSVVGHDSLGRIAKHVGHSKIDRLYAVGLLEHEAVVGSGLTHHIQRAAFALCDACHPLYIVGVEHHAHAFLTLITNDLLGRQSLVTYRKSIEIDMAAGSLNQFRQSVEMSACAVVVDRHDRIAVALGKSTYDIADTLLHLGIGSLHSVQLDSVGILTCSDRRNGAAAHTDAVVVATHHHYLLTRLWSAFDSVARCGEAYASGKHDHLIISIELAVLIVLKRKQRSANQRLTEFISEIRRSVRSLDEYVARCLIKPHTRIHHQLPAMLGTHARI